MRSAARLARGLHPFHPLTDPAPDVKGRLETAPPPTVGRMKHITYAEKSLLLGDATADLLLEYAAALGSDGTSDSISIRAISSDGDEVDATFLIGEGAPLMSETTTSTLPEPDNTAAEEHMRERIGRLARPPHGGSLDDDEMLRDDYDEFPG